MPRPRSRRALPRIQDISDRQPTDKVVRRDGKLWLVDTNGAYADLELLDSETTDYPTFQANARLIATAPELLAALEHCVNWITDSFPHEDDQPNSIVSEARTALAKAKGGQSNV